MAIVNPRSIVAKVNEMETWVNANLLQVIAVVETWLHGGIEDSVITPSGFEVFRRDRPSRGGGVCILANNSLHPERVMPDVSYADLEVLFVDLHSTGSPPLRIATVYCPPCYTNSEEYIRRIAHCLLSMTRRSGEMIIMGDFNRPGIKWLSWDRVTCSSTIDLIFKDLMYNMGLTQIATFPTRGKNFLTLVLCNTPGNIGTVEPLPPFNNADNPPHLPVCLTIMTTSEVPSLRPVHKNYSAIDYEWAHLLLNNLNISSFTLIEDGYDSFYNIISKIINSAPNHRFFRHRPPAWDMARVKNRAWRILRQYPCPHNRALYDSISSSYKDQVSSLRSETLYSICSSLNRKAFFQHNKSGPLNNYSILRRNDGKLCSNDRERAQVFLSAFDKAYRPDVPIDHSFLIPQNIPSDSHELFDYTHIYRLLNSLKRNAAMGPDDIPALLLKNTVTVSAHLLSTLFIRFFGEGWIPPSWRKAIIIPIFKNSGPASDVTNYRPIALTNIIAKIYEKCILRGLLQYLTSHDLIPSGQFGGLPGRSTTLQLIHCYDQWSRMSEAGNHYDTFFLDITKAFDRVPRSRLASCLCDLGIPHILVRAIMLLFDDRSHRVRVGSTLSATSSTSSGVIQGTVLGCILFVLYTAPLSTIIYPIVLYTFIDDIKWSVNTSQDSNAQDHLNKITSWLEKHGLEVSAPKSCVLHCGRHNPKSIYTTYGNDITTCDIHKDLGIFFSRDLGFNHHIESIVSKANRISFGVLSRYRGCDRSSLTLAFTTFIRPILEYAAPLWSPSQVLQIDHIERVQRSFTRRLFPGDTPSYGDRCSRLSIHSLEWRRIYLDLCLFYKIIEKPVYGSPLVDPISFCPPNSTRGHNRKIKIPFTRSTVRKNSFFLRAAEIWNNLPQDIVNAETMGTFKAKLKYHDLSTYCHRFKF